MSYPHMIQTYSITYSALVADCLSACSLLSLPILSATFARNSGEAKLTTSGTRNLLTLSLDKQRGEDQGDDGHELDEDVE